MKVLKISTLFDKKMKQILYVPNVPVPNVSIFPQVCGICGKIDRNALCKKCEAYAHFPSNAQVQEWQQFAIDRYSIGDEAPNFCDYDIVFAGRWC